MKKETDFLTKVGIFLIFVLIVCLLMIATTYQQLQEVEENVPIKERKNIDAKLDEMIRRMEKKYDGNNSGNP
jgi:CHASE3 domain sensor protein